MSIKQAMNTGSRFKPGMLEALITPSTEQIPYAVVYQAAYAVHLD